MMVFLGVHATSPLNTGAHFAGPGTLSIPSRTSSASIVSFQDSFSLPVAWDSSESGILRKKPYIVIHDPDHGVWSCQCQGISTWTFTKSV